MANIPEVFFVSYGVQLASSWVNAMLYMLELVMCLRYFQRSSRPLPHKIGVGAMVLFDTLCTMAINANVFITFQVFFGKAAFSSLNIGTTATLFMTYSTASIEQWFLIHLYFILTRNRVISICLAFFVIVHLGFSFAAGIMLQTFSLPFTERLTFAVTAAGAILCAIMDMLIAGFLGYEFFKIKTKTSASSPQSLIRRVYILTVTSGALVASTTLLMMILFLKGDIAFEFFFSCQGRVYALTLLVNFLSGPSSSPATPSSDKPGSLVFQVDAYPLAHGSGNNMRSTQPAPSIYSNFSEDSINKELPPLPTTAGLPTPAEIKLPSSPKFAPRYAPSSPAHAQFAAFPRRMQFASADPQSALASPRMVVAVPYRVESLPQP
ncbi:hypothetical protein C8R44DRAFT_849601 [Mycena epipterygia]|nr:hypothetical protein C8R44DRAFT_849601 [Mycena epipterygia]